MWVGKRGGGEEGGIDVLVTSVLEPEELCDFGLYVSVTRDEGSPLVGHCTLQDPPLEVYPNRSIHQCHRVSLRSGISRLPSFPRTDYGRGVTMEDQTELYV